MADEERPLRMSRREEVLERYLGKYIVVYPQLAVGRLAEMVDGYFVLNPHQGGDIDENVGVLKRLTSQDSLVRIESATQIKPTTRKNIEADCIHFNNQVIKNYQRENQESAQEQVTQDHSGEDSD